MKPISIKGLDKALLLAALYCAAHDLATHGFHVTAKPGMSRAEASEHLARGDTFKKLNGRVLNITLANDDMDPSGYNAENGHLAAELVVEALRDFPALDYHPALSCAA
ncbi:MAG: hypothetical protein JWR74_1179 [Polaromonas sp.]|nr:hypothetical protein [Polaromonas sp.]